jgi:hypothetical protein
MVKTDITKMTAAEIAAFLQEKKQRDGQEKHARALKAMPREIRVDATASLHSLG